ncbi:MAG: glycogen/starch synthase [Cytophagales bacterium]|nr:glycogen/starch synthase [Cytophagales bacterium]
MADKVRILYVASEIKPFLKLTDVGDFVRKLPQAMHEKGMEIRILVPRFGVINERKNRLHEVVRLSGINISMDGDEKPLVIKVASIPNAKLQVYFIDNEDYFQRKSAFVDKEGEFHADNDERAIFFCKGVLETVRKLGWAPDIIHCNDWMTSLIPLYLNTTYCNDPIFQNSKSVFSVYDNAFDFQFEGDTIAKAKTFGLEDDLLQHLSSANYENFVKIGVENADCVINTTESEELVNEAKEVKQGAIELSEDALDSYYNLYNEIANK